MPRRVPRSQRRHVRRPPAVRPTPPAPIAPEAVAVGEEPEPAAVEPRPAVAVAEPAREPSVTRFTARDYTYVKRELRRIAILAVVMVIVIVTLSFFLP